MNTLVTGGLGFLGSTISKLLSEKGETVICYDQRSSNGENKQSIYNVQGDLRDLPFILETIKNYNVDKIIHTAAISHPYFSRKIPYQTVMINAVGTTNIFESARLTGIKRIVNLSSECVYGNNRELGIITEEAPLNPTTPYGVTKVFTEKMGQVYNNLYGMEIISLRPGWIYGPGQFMQCYMKTLLRNAIDGLPTYEKNGKDYLFQYVHVKDVANACIIAADVNIPSLQHNVFNITGGNQISYGNLVERIKKIFPLAQIEIGGGTIDVLDQNAEFEIRRAREELGFVPQISLDEGINEYAKWLEKHEY
ncbi:NAD-dependent epimerase/dehydratase family protein [Terrilactibacillus tamarindi]|uniref:NAD-dependent epimerase/dehydratase family protein n=1 Tax=Terrilactibacillus tamarindi TaxID=2599694 RepID=UPI0012BC038A|nr:NAD(P)-dependent oxidoreductase [Terrilactibacillus tamarindi]